jgi:predicted transglutaminase-like cysteine proteinase
MIVTQKWTPMPTVGFRIGSIGVIPLLILSGSISGASEESHLSIGENALAPLAYTEFCFKKPDRCAPSEQIRQITFDLHNQLLIESVNRSVNRSIIPLSDPPNSRRSWRDDAKFGDCNQFALKKRSQLLDLKLPPSALLLVVAIVPGGEGHLVLIVATDRGDFVLDNVREDVVRWDSLPYLWIKRSSPENPQFWQTIIPPNARVGPVGGLSWRYLVMSVIGGTKQTWPDVRL